jgi:hypothetical protein
MERILVKKALAVAMATLVVCCAFVGIGSRVAGAVTSSVTSIPVLTWHELNNGCAASALVCNATDPESVSTTQLTNELAYLKTQNYHSISASQYSAWLSGKAVTLPANPIFLMADNGIYNFLSGAQSVLLADGFLVNVAVITGFDDGASGICPNKNFEPGCPVANTNWDATWSQLVALNPAAYDFVIESGSAGHFVQNYDPNCTVFYACKVPGETASAYEARVMQEVARGQAQIVSHLGSRFTAGLWVVPYSDAGYSACAQAGCTLQPYTGPAGWLTSWAATNFTGAFVQDAFRNGIQHERYRIDIQGWMSESQFESMLTSNVTSGDFTLVNTPVPAAPLPPPTSTTPVAAIPVFSIDSNTVNVTQVSAMVSYLMAQGYNAISSTSYESWASGSDPALPAKPVLITFSGGNATLLGAATPVLINAGYSAVAFVSTQVADSAGGVGSWAQLQSLGSTPWTFSFSSGAAGGTSVASDPIACNIYYACAAPGETDAAYQARVSGEIGAGRSELDNTLWAQHVDDFMWQPPFGDVGLTGQAYNGPSGWLPLWASWVFPVVFVPSGAAGNNEHNEMLVDGSTTVGSFGSTLTSSLSSGAFSR